MVFAHGCCRSCAVRGPHKLTSSECTIFAKGEERNTLFRGAVPRQCRDHVGPRLGTKSCVLRVIYLNWVCSVRGYTGPGIIGTCMFRVRTGPECTVHHLFQDSCPRFTGVRVHSGGVCYTCAPPRDVEAQRPSKSIVSPSVFDGVCKHCLLSEGSQAAAVRMM